MAMYDDDMHERGVPTSISINVHSPNTGSDQEEKKEVNE
jgi:hypothetical protein